MSTLSEGMTGITPKKERWQKLHPVYFLYFAKTQCLFPFGELLVIILSLTGQVMQVFGFTLWPVSCNFNLDFVYFISSHFHPEHIIWTPTADPFVCFCLKMDVRKNRCPVKTRRITPHEKLHTKNSTSIVMFHVSRL